MRRVAGTQKIVLGTARVQVSYGHGINHALLYLKIIPETTQYIVMRVFKKKAATPVLYEKGFDLFRRGA